MKHKSLNFISPWELIYIRLAKIVVKYEILNFMDYDKEAAKKDLIKKIGWKDYGNKHGESIWTRFFQNYYLPTRFGYDKRKWHYSSLICSNQITREEALKELAISPYRDSVILNHDIDFVLRNLNITQSNFEEIMNSKNNDTKENKNDYW